MALRPAAILLDLYGTLVPGGAVARRDAVAREVGRVLGVDADAMASAVRDTYDERARGALGDLCATLGALARRDGGSRELTGAAALGMRAVRLESDGEGRVDPDREWTGPSIASLADLRL